ncbi:MAG: hypothetical protein HZC04_01695 [Candidatus Lloydbacteria bacterium]|nr:hypothetical protein [Candidatus Lloydbacteria bacterium]
MLDELSPRVTIQQTNPFVVITNTLKEWPMLKLFIEKKEIQDSVLPIRWNIDQETTEKILESEIGEPLLFLVAVGKDRVEHREVVPLKQMMHYLQLRTSGEIKIFAGIIYSQNKSQWELKKIFLERSNHCSYRTEVFEETTDSLKLGRVFYSINHGYAYLFRETSAAEISIHVPKEAFAKEPPKWEQKWVNWFYETKPVDQCQYRRRRIIAYTVQPFIISVCFILKMVLNSALVCFNGVICGRRDTEWRSIIRPFLYAPDDNGYDSSSVYFTKKGGKTQFLPLFLFNPATIVFGVIIMWVVLYKQYDAAFSFWPTFAYTIIAIGSFSVIGITLYSAADFLASGKLTGKLKKYAYFKNLFETAREERRAYLKNAYAVLSSEVPETVSLDTLPKEKQTIYLRFLDLKAKVCRPFAD